MKKMVLLLSLAVAAPAFASETWNVVEGSQGAVKGNWNIVRQGTTVTGSAKMSAPHASVVSFGLAGKAENGVVTMKRVDASDHVDCVYRGAMKGDGSIVGASICGAQHGPWIAQPIRK